MNALERGQEMMVKPMASLPVPALKYAAHLCSRLGKCMEVLLTAYTAYAQIIEGLPCDDELYQVKPEDKQEFQEAQDVWKKVENDPPNGGFKLVPSGQ